MSAGTRDLCGHSSGCGNWSFFLLLRRVLEQNPSFENQKLSIESYLLDFDDDLYGRNIRLFFLNRLRDELKFKNLSDLKLQIESDVSEIRNLFS